MFCSYSQYKGKDFVLTAKAALIRDDKVHELRKRDYITTLASTIYLPTESYLRTKAITAPQSNILPSMFLNVLSGNPDLIDKETPVRLDREKVEEKPPQGLMSFGNKLMANLTQTMAMKLLSDVRHLDEEVKNNEDSNKKMSKSVLLLNKKRWWNKPPKPPSVLAYQID